MTSIRVATLNLWNSDNTGHLQIDRLRAAAEELIRLDAGIVALQEVRSHLADDQSSDAATFLKGKAGYEFMAFRPFPGDPGEGLAFLGKHPLRVVEPGSTTIGDCALRVTLDIEGIGLALTNVHLDYASVATRERQIVEVMNVIARESDGDRYEVLLGDFNSYPESSVYQFLAGQQTLHGHETVPWHDLARSCASRSGSEPAPTLDFWNNPRWRDKPNLDRPARCDWILFRDTFASSMVSPSMTEAGVFGDEATPIARVVPSDHYGVHADLLFPDGGGQGRDIP